MIFFVGERPDGHIVTNACNAHNEFSRNDSLRRRTCCDQGEVYPSKAVSICLISSSSRHTPTGPTTPTLGPVFPGIWFPTVPTLRCTVRFRTDEVLCYALCLSSTVNRQTWTCRLDDQNTFCFGADITFILHYKLKGTFLDSSRVPTTHLIFYR